MSAEHPIVGRKNAVDGSVEVWVSHRVIRFPADGGRPCSKPGEPPEGMGLPPDELRVRADPPVTHLRYGDWIVIVGKDTTRVLPARPIKGAVAEAYRRIHG